MNDVDVCIVGAGPAGLILASRFIDTGLTVRILESGRDEGRSPEPSAGTVDGDPILGLDLDATRRRGVGGNAELWCAKTDRSDGRWNLGVRYGTLTSSALSTRPWVEHSGWPIGEQELRRWYLQAHELLALGEPDYEVDDVEPDHEVADVEASMPSVLDSPDFDRRRYRFGHRNRILRDLRSRIERAPRLTLQTASTVTRLERRSDSPAVDRVEYVDGSGTCRHLGARVVVLACGAIENARLLLDSDREHGGIGNEHDNVGRYFADHPLFATGEFRLRDRGAIRRFAFFDFVERDGAPDHGHVVTSPSWCERHEAVEIAVTFFPRPNRRAVAAIEAARELVHSRRLLVRRPAAAVRTAARLPLGVGQLPWMARTSLGRRQSLLPGFGRGGWSVEPLVAGFTELEMVFQCEQPPSAASRVTLSHQIDRFGSRLPDVTWRLGEQTERSALALQREMVTALNGLGCYVPRSGSLDELRPPASLAHHLGTTRMSTSPQAGVVDADCCVHTCPNLFIAGSSVFPAHGYVNPTLTIAALALRLGETLIERLTAS